MEPVDFIAFLVEAGALRFGEFTLKSGEASPFFVNLGDVKRGSHLRRLGAVLAAALETRFPAANVLFGPPYKGIALAAACAMAAFEDGGRDLCFCTRRKERKDHGERGSFIGHVPVTGDRVVILDDVLSSGGTKIEAAASIEATFAVRPVGVLVALDRRRRGVAFEGPPLGAVAALPDLIRYLRERSDPRAGAVARFYDGGEA